MLFLFGVAMLSLGIAVARRVPGPQMAELAPSVEHPSVVPPPKPAPAEPEAERQVPPAMPVAEVTEVDAGTAAVAPEIEEMAASDPAPPVAPPVPGKPEERVLKPGILGFAAEGDAVIYLDGHRLGKGFVIAANLPAGGEHEVRAVSADGVEVKRRVVVAEGENRLVKLVRPGFVAGSSAEPVRTEVPAGARRVNVLSVTRDTRLVALRADPSGDLAPLAAGGIATWSDGAGGAPVLLECERVFGPVSVCRYVSDAPAEGRGWLKVTDMK